MQHLRQGPYWGLLFAFRGQFVWLSPAEGEVVVTTARLAMPLKAID